MKYIVNYISEGLRINKKLNFNKSQIPKDLYELKKIIEERLKKDKNANLNDIDISNITNMHGLFHKLDPHNIDISEWDVSHVENMEWMFYYCTNFNCDISNWDVSNVENFEYAFSGCKKLNCDLNKWKPKDVKNKILTFKNTSYENNPPEWYKE